MNSLSKAIVLISLAFLPVSVQAEELYEMEYCDFVEKYRAKTPHTSDDMFYNPDYQAHMDKDVYGNPVVGADIEGKTIGLPEEYRFDLTLDLAQRTGIHLPSGMKAESNLGQVIYRNGDVFIGDQKLNDEDVTKLENDCKSPTK